MQEIPPLHLILYHVAKKIPSARQNNPLAFRLAEEKLINPELGT